MPATTEPTLQPVVCTRCGLAGHAANVCDREALPIPERLDLIEAEVEQITMMAQRVVELARERFGAIGAEDAA